MTRNVWRCFPTRRNPRIIVGPGDNVRNALRLWNPYSIAGRITKAILTALPGALASRILPAIHNEAELRRLEQLAALIQSAADTTNAVVSAATGTPGPDRKWTFQVTGARHGSAVQDYAKVGTSDNAARLLAAERSVLGLLAASPGLSFGFPELLHFAQEADITLLIQTGGGAGLQPCPPHPGTGLMKVMVELAGIQRSDVAVADLIGPPEPGGSSTVGDAGTWANARELIWGTCPAGRVVTTFAHGDFAPWNIGILPDGRHYIFDWEYATAGVPALNDLIHFIFMPLALVGAHPPRETVSRLLAGLAGEDADQLLAATGIAREQLPAYILLYLNRLRQRHLGLAGHYPGYLSDCAHHVLVQAGWQGERPRVLMAAYACEPDQGSEPGVGWNMALAAGQDHEVWVVTRRNNQPVIEARLARDPIPGLHFIYVDLPRWARFWKRGGRGVRTYYYLWQLLAWWEVRRRCEEQSFDLAHHVTFVNDWIFSFLGLLDLPFVWGPVGSNPPVPAALANGWKQQWKDRLRYGVQQVVRTFDPLYWQALARARLIVTINADLAGHFPLNRVGEHRLAIHTAIGVEELPLAPRIREPREPGLRVLTVGKLLPVKGMHLAVHAFAGLAKVDPAARLRIVGDGPQKAELQELIQRYRITGQVRFDPWLPRPEVLAAMADADVLLFPSFEGAGMVVLEAMASGLPVICLDFGGPGEMVADGCGQRVQVGDLSTTVAGLTAALELYSTDPELRQLHGIQSRQHVAGRYLWRSRSAVLRAWYKRALGLPGPGLSPGSVPGSAHGP